MPQGAWKERLKHPLLQSFGDLIYPNLTPIMTIIGVRLFKTPPFTVIWGPNLS